MSELAVINCGQLVTLAGPPRPRRGVEMRDLGILADGVMRARDGRIAAIGSLAEIGRSLSSNCRIVDAKGRVVMPGFVDAHTHPVFAGNRADEYEARAGGAAYSEIAARGGGILSTVRQTRAAPEDALFHAARRYTDWFLRTGTTTVEAKSGYGLSLQAEQKILRVIARLNAERRLRYVPTFLGAHETPEEYRGRTADYANTVIHDMLPRIAEQRLAEYCDVFCEPQVFPAPLAVRIANAARALCFGIRMHADQFTADYGSLAAAEAGAATADHLEFTTSLGLEALDAAGVQPVLLPASVYNLGSTHYPDARRMIELGMPVVLATDFNPGSSPTASMTMVLSLACTHMKMTPAEAITACTINAAWSLNRADESGSLEPGKAADFVVHDCDDYRELPYFFGRETAVAAYVDGACVYSRHTDR